MPWFDPSAKLRVEASAAFSVFFCFFIGLSYVLFLYIKADLSLQRDHPTTIKRRFIRVALCCIFSILLFRVGCCVGDEEGEPLWRLLAFKLQGILASTLLALLLCMILFFGPLVQNYYNGLFQVIFSFSYWKSCFQSIIWLRTIIVGPWTEEIVYRSCMLPVLVAGFGTKISVCINPLFFGLAHFHHVCMSIKGGTPPRHALLSALFQFSFTTIFGIFSAFLLVRTGNILSSITCHMFCNFMGFPDLQDLFHNHSSLQTRIIIITYVIGLVLFSILLLPLTSSHLFQYI